MDQRSPKDGETETLVSEEIEVCPLLSLVRNLQNQTVAEEENILRVAALHQSLNEDGHDQDHDHNLFLAITQRYKDKEGDLGKLGGDNHLLHLIISEATDVLTLSGRDLDVMTHA